MNKLILAEKPSTAKILAHVVGAREKIYGRSRVAIKKYCKHYVKVA